MREHQIFVPEDGQAWGGIPWEEGRQIIKADDERINNTKNVLGK